MTKEITPENIKTFNQKLNNLPTSTIAKNTVANNGILASSQNLASKIAMEPTFSVEIDTGKVADQKQSGRCWMFAALNTMRHPLQMNFKLKDFELSQNFTNFWDKFEKSNWFLENVINTAALPLGDRKVDFLMTTPQQDGGQWDMLVAIIQKYGLVPKSVMPETFSSSKSAELNSLLNLKLRKDAIELRKLANDGNDETVIESRKDEMMSEVYRILVYTLGTPPTTFDFEYTDDEKEYHRFEGLTPKTFFEKFVGWNLEDYVSIINSPQSDKPFNHTFTVDLLGNVIGGRQVKHLNLEIEELKRLAILQLQAGETVWFGSDVGQESERKLGIMDTNFYQREELFDIDLSMTKAERLDHAESLMTHAMVITGVDLVDGKPTKWKVENSWGEKVGNKGYFVMSDEWFDEFVYQVVINKQFLTDAQKTTYETEEPKVLAPWDPMGSLAF